MIDELVIKQLTPKGLEDVRYLAKASFGYNYDSEYLAHKYNTKQYSDEGFLCCIGYIDDQPVGFYGGVPVSFKNHITQENVLMVQTCDSYTHPDYQRKGIHRQLALASYELMKLKGVKGVFALHSENTFHSCKKLGWSVQSLLSVFQLNVKTSIPWLKIMDKIPQLNQLSDRRINRVLEQSFELSSSFNNLVEQKTHSVDYSQEFIQYKNRYRCFILKIGDCKVWVRIRSIIYVGAIENLHENNLALVKSTLTDLAKKLGTNKVFFQVHEDHPSRAVLNGFMKSVDGYKIGYLCFDETMDFSTFFINHLDFDNFL